MFLIKNFISSIFKFVFFAFRRKKSSFDLLLNELEMLSPSKIENARNGNCLIVAVFFEKNLCLRINSNPYSKDWEPDILVNKAIYPASKREQKRIVKLAKKKICEFASDQITLMLSSGE